jgi:O-antigen/teichoic acid export membrane protein
MTETIAQKSHSSNLGGIVFKNTFFITLGNLALKILDFLFNIYVVRRLGDNRLGRYAVVLAFVGLFQIFAELGISQYVMREIAKDRSRTKSLIWNLVVLRLLLAILALGWITLLGIAFGFSQEVVLGIFIFTSTFILAAIQAPIQTVLTAYERFDYVTAMTVVRQIALVILGTIFLFSGLGFIWLIVANLISILPAITLGIWAVRRLHLIDFEIQVTPRAWPALLRAGLPFGIISLTLMISFSIDTVMLKMFKTDNVVGWYSVAYSLIFGINFLTRGFKEAIVPSLSHTFVRDPSKVEWWYYRTVRVIMMLSSPIAVGGMLIAYPLIRVLYTEAFLPSALALQILIWDSPLLMFSAFCGNITTVIGEERSAARIYTINALANIILNALLIPRFGFVGASVVTVVTDLIGALQFYSLLRRKLNMPNITSILCRVSIAAMLMGISIWAIGFLTRQLTDIMILIVSFGTGFIVYISLILALRLLDQTEWALIHKLFDRVGGVLRPVKDTTG